MKEDAFPNVQSFRNVTSPEDGVVEDQQVLQQQLAPVLDGLCRDIVDTTRPASLKLLNRPAEGPPSEGAADKLLVGIRGEEREVLSQLSGNIRGHRLGGGIRPRGENGGRLSRKYFTPTSDNFRLNLLGLEDNIAPLRISSSNLMGSFTMMLNKPPKILDGSLD